MRTVQRLRKKVKGREFILIVFLIILTVVLELATKTFFTSGNMKDILLNVSHVIVAATGMTMVIIIGHIDVSLGALLAVLSLSMGQMAKAGLPGWLYCAITIVFGILLGSISGIIIGYLKVPAIICTLGLTNLYRGLIIVITNGAWVQELPKSFNAIGKGNFLGIPIPIIVSILVALCGWIFMKYSRTGRSIYAIGSNSNAASLSGISVKKTTLFVYMIMGGLMGVASIIYATRFITIQSNTGSGFEMLAIAAAIVGGTNIMGGSGTIIGTLIGAILLGIIRTGLVLLKISTYWEQSVQGLIILISVLFGLYNHYAKRKSSIYSINE